MPDPQLLAFTAVIFLFAGSIKGVIGVGLPTVAVGLMTAFVGLHEAVQLVVVPAFLTNVWQGAMGGQFKMLVRRLWPLLMASCLGTWVGASILVAIDPRYLSGTLGGLLAAYSFYSLLTPQIPPPGRWEKALNPVMGFLAGIATGCVASFVMPGALYLQALGLTRDALVQAMGIAFTVVTAAQARIRRKRAQGAFARAIRGALAVQTWWRGVATRRRFANLRHSTIVAQTRRRAVCARRAFARAKRAVLVVQGFLRDFVARRRFEKVARRVQRIARLVRTLQTGLRAFLARRRFVVAKRGIVLLQAAWRGRTQRRRAKAIVLQSWARMLAKRRALREAIAAAIVVQTVGRRCTARNRFRAINAAIVLQAAGRRFMARKRYDVLKATLRLQAAGRRIIATRRLAELRAAVALQTCTRRFVAATRFQRIVHAVTALQARWRRRPLRERYAAVRASTVMIQTNWRRTNMKRKLGDLKWAALFVRAARLRVAATRRFLRLRNAATAIGKTARGWLVRRRLLITTQSTPNKFSIKRGITLCCCLRIPRLKSAWLDRACGFSLMSGDGMEKTTMGPEITTQPDGSLRVCLTESGITACCSVSSAQLVDSCLPQTERLIVSHQLPIWMARLAGEGRPLAHDPRKRECALASVTSFTFEKSTLVSVSYENLCADLQPGHAVAGA